MLPGDSTAASDACVSQGRTTKPTTHQAEGKLACTFSSITKAQHHRVELDAWVGLVPLLTWSADVLLPLRCCPAVAKLLGAALEPLPLVFDTSGRLVPCKVTGRTVHVPGEITLYTLYMRGPPGPGRGSPCRNLGPHALQAAKMPVPVLFGNTTDVLPIPPDHHKLTSVAPV